MPLRKDHLMLVTDAGVTLHLGWDYDIPYHLDPLNGVDVDLQLAQGVNQIGNTVERQVVSGVYRTLTADCWSEHGDADAKLILDALPFFTKGTLYFGDKWFCRFVLSKTPYTSQYHPYPRIEALLYCENPTGTVSRHRPTGWAGSLRRSGSRCATPATGTACGTTTPSSTPSTRAVCPCR